jgi:hypothetical protein
MLSAMWICRAQEIVSNGFVRDIKLDADTKEIAATVGSVTHAWKQQYIVTCCLSSISAADPRFINSCNCPQHEQTGVCKHSIALALTQLPSGWLHALSLGMLHPMTCRVHWRIVQCFVAACRCGKRNISGPYSTVQQISQIQRCTASSSRRAN